MLPKYTISLPFPSLIMECCMCGDRGLSSEIFKCSSCGFRSQHKYCSNLYPKAESYNICNWCLSQKGEEITTKMSLPHGSRVHDHEKMKIKKSKRDGGDGGKVDDTIKKHSILPAAPPPASGWKRVNGGGSSERNVKRNRSEEMAKSGMIIRPVFRNRVRRYKLLDEVSS